MDSIVNVFQNRPGKSLSSLIVAIIGVVTILMFQEVEVKTLSAVFNYLNNSTEASPLMSTWLFNLLAFALNIAMGVTWFKEVMRYNYMDHSPETARIVSLIISILHFLYSILFFNYIFSKLLGLVVVVVIVIVLVKNSEK
ncbi:TPA: hypothetical protein QCU24_003329 [Bacillus cereus]|uniref:hypothetical protein n=1 Tax=Bacillus cereus TaxID=1396 RepID=UPI002A080B11|nr:hypothetical protein [Bacillus cereus]MDA2730455.1 hypothetical protein [Bacillus cereus]HDR6245576.1 hypothetical protein [Bacillus cereus]